MVISFASIEDGEQIAFRLVGDPDKPTILFTNGSIFNYRQFDQVIYPRLRSKLGPEYSYLFYDYIGIGKSSPLNGEFDFVTMANQQLALLDYLELGKVHLFGYSKGSIINQIMTALSPERVLSMAGYGNPNLANPKSSKLTKTEFQARVRNLEDIKNIWEERISHQNYAIVYEKVFLPTVFRDKKPEQFSIIDRAINWWTRRKLRPLLLNTPIISLYKLYKYYMEDINSEQIQNYTRAIKGITVSTLLMHGTDDEIVPYSSSELLHQWIRGSEFVSFEGMTHSRPILLSWKGKPIADTYLDFISRVS